MTEPVLPDDHALITSVAWIAFHILVIALSAGIALSLPVIAENLLVYWSRVEHEEILLVSIELAVAVVLIVFFNYVRLSLRHRNLAQVAISAGLVSSSTNQNRQTRRRIKVLKERHGLGRSLMVIGSTGYETFVDPASDFRAVLQKCLWANILLLDPYSEEASLRVQALSRPDFTLDRFREEGRQTIELLKKLKAGGKNIKLKFYADPPIVKLVILGDYLWLQHYHTSLEVHTLPEYVLQHNLRERGLYTLFYQYFAQRWEDHGMPEYDLDADEVIYRNPDGGEMRRSSFGPDSVCGGGRQTEETYLSRSPLMGITRLSTAIDSRHRPFQPQSSSRIIFPPILGMTGLSCRWP